MPVPGAVLDPSAVVESSAEAVAADDHRVPLTVARPAGATGPLAGLIVIHHAAGVDEHTRDVVRRFAAQGFLAVAPDLFARIGGAPDMTAGSEAVMAKLGAQTDAGAVSDLAATAAWIRSQPDASGRVAVIGFCMGGRLALLIATHPGVVDRAIDCWGGRITRRTLPPDEAHPEVVVERVDRLACPLLGIFGELDGNPDHEDVEELRAALERHRKEHRIVVYPEAGHAFFADTVERAYRDGPAHQAWEEFLRFLEPLRDPAPADATG